MMQIEPNGIDVFYVDESEDGNVQVMSAVTVPFVRPHDGRLHIVWDDYLKSAQTWRRGMKNLRGIPMKHELHGTRLLRGKGKPKYGKFNFKKWEAARAFREAMQAVTFLPDESIFAVSGAGAGTLYGQSRLERVAHALFQRMRRQCLARNVNAIVFFDEGHPEYRKLYRRARVYLPTGSQIGGWRTGQTANYPLSMFAKDANMKDSKHCYFTQLADLVSYSAFLKRKHEVGTIEPWQANQNAQSLFDAIPVAARNTRVSGASNDGILRL
jgi:hypothetical protein